MEIRVGTSGYAYKEWRGSFYPEKLKPAAMLGYYCGALLDGRDQQHLLQAPGARDARALGRAGARRLRVRAEGIPAHHAPPAPLAGVEGDRRLPAGHRRGARGPARARSCSRPRRSSRRTWRGCARSWNCFRATAVSPSSSATRPGGTTRSTRRCARATPRSCAPTPTSRAPRARRSSRPPTGATCACAAPTTTQQALAPWAARIRSQPWRQAFVFFKHEEGQPLGWPAIERFLARRAVARAWPTPRTRSNPPDRGCVRTRQRTPGGRRWTSS